MESPPRDPDPVSPPVAAAAGRRRRWLGRRRRGGEGGGIQRGAGAAVDGPLWLPGGAGAHVVTSEGVRVRRRVGCGAQHGRRRGLGWSPLEVHRPRRRPGHPRFGKVAWADMVAGVDMAILENTIVVMTYTMELGDAGKAISTLAPTLVPYQILGIRPRNNKRTQGDYVSQYIYVALLFSNLTYMLCVFYRAIWIN
uniref:Uncharacterized protein n=1 Tax=Leersia perrieri TaxID=77586 RepID=A0A0D9WE24_9ORYZ